jgi:two-component sensor histidine kinase
MELRQSVDEKDVLLKEIHHRVKNNLLVVSSILELQKDAYEDPRLSQAIDLSQGRIKSMSMIHESLYQSNNLSSVDFSTYLDTLSDDLLHAYSVKNANIRIIKNLDSLALNIETATPLGLIVNELITNSLKHAFDPEAPGILEIKLCRQDDDSFSLCISDNGKATHQESDFSESAGLGWKLIRLLASQLDASIVIQPNDGLTVCIQASQLNYRKRGV